MLGVSRVCYVYHRIANTTIITIFICSMNRICQKFGKISKRCFSDPLGPEKHESVNEKFPKFGLHAEKWQKWRKSGFGGKYMCPKVKEVGG